MTRWIVSTLLFALLAAPTHSVRAAADGDKPAKAMQASDTTMLTADQRRALGIVVGHAPAAQIPDRIDSLGLVLDTTTLVGDL